MRKLTDRLEQCRNGQILNRSRGEVAQGKGLQTALAGKFFNNRFTDKFDVLFCSHLFGKIAFGTQFVSAVNKVNARAILCENERILHRGVTATNNGNLATAEKHSITGCAEGNAATDEGILTVKPQFAMLESRSENYRTGAVFLFACRKGEFIGILCNSADRSINNLHTESGDLLGKAVGKGVAVNIGQCGIVFYFSCWQNLTAKHFSFKKDNAFAGACRIKRGCHAGGAATNNGNIIFHIVFSFKNFYLTRNAFTRSALGVTTQDQLV